MKKSSMNKTVILSLLAFIVLAGTAFGGQNPLLWEKTIGQGEATQVVTKGGTVAVVSTFADPTGIVNLHLIVTDEDGVARWDSSISRESFQNLADPGRPAAAIDRSGSLYVGLMDIIIKHNPDGTVAWEKTLPNDRILKVVTGPSDELLVFSLRLGAYTLTKYDSAGTFAWNLPSLSSLTSDLAVDGTGSVVLALTSDYYRTFAKIQKYSPDGALVLTAIDYAGYQGGVCGNNTSIAEVKTDASGNIIVSGYKYILMYCRGGAEATPYIIKFSPDGVVLESKLPFYPDSRGGYEWNSGFGALEIDRKDNIIVSKWSYANSSSLYKIKNKTAFRINDSYPVGPIDDMALGTDDAVFILGHDANGNIILSKMIRL